MDQRKKKILVALGLLVFFVATPLVASISYLRSASTTPVTDTNYLGHWAIDNVPTNAHITVPLYGSQPGGVIRYDLVMLKSGSVIGIVFRSSAIRAAGAIQAILYKNSLIGTLSTTIDGSNPWWNETIQAPGIDTFVAGDLIQVRIEAASWSPTTADFIVELLIQY